MTNDDLQAIWDDTTAQLKRILNEDTYDRWIAGIIPLSLDDTCFRLGVSNGIFSEWLNNNYKELIVGTLATVTGMPLKVAFESGHERRMESPDAEPSAAKPHARADTPTTPVPQLPYNRRFTFDTFVIGENNKFAMAASSAVAKAPGKAYNPLFIHGGTGLGKTHLLQAVAQDLLARRKRVRIEYLSSEEFANSFIDALRDRALPKFRRHFRNVDLLLIDDVHFFTGKEQLQEEFFHTFNALYNRHKQIVMTSDRPPHEIQGLEKRLVSRFEWGLTTEIQKPNLETRIAILRNKQADHAVQLDDSLLLFVADRIKSNVRRLEGALIRLVSFASMTGQTPTVAIAEQLLRPILEEEASNNLTIEAIQRHVAEYYDIRLADMTSRRRPHNIAFPRQVAMYLSRKLTDFSSPAIADSFNRNHATVLHAVTAVETRMGKDPELRHVVGKFERDLCS